MQRLRQLVPDSFLFFKKALYELKVLVSIYLESPELGYTKKTV